MYFLYTSPKLTLSVKKFVDLEKGRMQSGPQYLGIYGKMRSLNHQLTWSPVKKLWCLGKGRAVGSLTGGDCVTLG